MALKRIKMLLIMSLMVALWGVTMAQSQPSCTNVLISLSPCLDYITGNVSTPTSGCCSQLATVVSSQPQCLCEVFNGGASSSFASGLNIDRTRALALPSACRVQTPPISTCSGSSPPTGIPVSNIPNPPSGIGSNTVFSTTGGSGNGRGSSHGSSSSTKLPSSLLLFLLAMSFAALPAHF